MAIRSFDAEEFTAQCCLWIKARVELAHADKIVLGLSGGIDSAVVAALSAKAIGKDKLILVWLGCNSTVSEHDDAKAVAGKLDIPMYDIELIKPFEALCGALGEFDLSLLGLANTKSRLRMVTLYAIANSVNGIVAGTGDKSEDDIGYFTKYGDGGVDFSPIAAIYKSEVRELGRYLGIPERVITKPSSPGLWEGQTAEGELGLSYDDVENALEERFKEGCGDDIVERVQLLKESSEHKRNYPPIFKWPADPA